MLEIKIDRAWKREEYTISRLYVNGAYFGCNTLEDKDRGLTQSMSIAEIAKKKVYGKTAIPKGTYDVDYTYSQHFKKYLPYINNTKGFTGVRIHSGNTAEDSLGCILVGKNTKKGMITESRIWTDKLCTLIREAKQKGEKVTLIIE